MPDETRNEKYQRQTKEQFEELGRFVQQFEQMVDAARFSCVQLTSSSAQHQSLMNVTFHHRSMTAEPLIQIMRALYGEKIKTIKPETEEVDTISSILSQIGRDYSKLAGKRNELLHGTWYIGWANPADDDFSDLKVAKFKTPATGLALAETPKKVEDLREITAECKRVGDLIRALILTLIAGSKAKDLFIKDGQLWKRRPETASKSSK
jgi:hypothetical protein